MSHPATAVIQNRSELSGRTLGLLTKSAARVLGTIVFHSHYWSTRLTAIPYGGR